MSTLIRLKIGALFAAGGAVLSAGTYVAGQAPRTPTTTMALRDVVNTHAKTIVVFQRKAGTEDLARPTGRVPVMFDYTGAIPINPEVRVVDAQGVEVMPWTRLTGVTEVTSGVGIGVLEPVPQGMTYTIAGLRDGDQPAKAETTSSGTGKWGVGVRGVWGGQSNMNSLLNVGAYNVDKPPGSSLYEYQYWDSAKVPGYYYSLTGWGWPDSGSNVKPGRVAWLRILTAKLKARYGHDVPVAMIPWAFDSTGIDAFLPPSGLRWSGLMASGMSGSTYGLNTPVNYSGGGDIEFVVWLQGETGSETRQQYKDKLIQVCAGLLTHVGQFGRTAANFGFFPGVLGVYGATSVEHLRGAVMDFEAYAKENNRWPKARIGMSCIDLDPSDPNDGNSDTLHIGTPYAYWGNRRFLQTVLHFLGCATYSARGPQISSVARQGDGAIVTVTHGRTGASLVNKKGTALTGWYGNTAEDFSGTDVAITATITGANQITLSWAGSVGAATVWIKHAGHKLSSALSIHPDVSNLVYDDSPYTEGATGTDLYNGFPLMATPDAMAA